jgi:carboxymethylenebutenolidase
LALPAKTPAAAIILFHEWWGLNAQIRTVALDLAAKQGVAALAVDLYGGKLAGSADEAGALMAAVNLDEATKTCLAWMNWLKSNSFCNGKLATIGWCFGGGWSLNASLAAPVDATIIYYGNVQKTAAELKSLKGPVLGHFARRDQWINQAMVSGFEAEMAKAKKQLTAYWYDADHAFANPTGDHYDREDANLAWSRTTEFLKATLG